MLRPFTSSGSAAARGDTLLLVALGAIGTVAWLLCHPYQGLFHDANLYALQALARLDPDSLSYDIFLSHGSQDRYTLFSPLYAAAISLLGLDRAAALLTALSQAAFCAAAWQLGRSLLPRWAATAGVVLLVALPGQYGPLRIFTCIEPFLTARMAAEALVLAALAAALRGRRMLAVGLAVPALLLHPVMALAGLAACVVAWLTETWRAGAPGRAAAIAGALLLAALGGALALAGRFDEEWLSIVAARSPYLFVSGWHLEDWSRAVTGLLPLAAGALVLETPLKRACLSVLLTVLAGWLLTLLGADLLHAVFVTQLQPWRIEWLATAAAAILLPYLISVLWRDNSTRRSAALLLIAALIFSTQLYAASIGLGGLALLRVRPLQPRHARLVLLGAAALCTLAVCWRLASNSEFTDAHYLRTTLPAWLRHAMSFARDGAVLAALLALAIRLAASRARAMALSFMFVGSVGLSILIARHTLGDWVARAYPPSQVAAFESWRAQVPPQAQVLWNESPLSAWVLLKRANYISGLQSSGVVFSRDAALALKQRAQLLSTVVAPANFLDWDSIGPALPLDAGSLLSVCRLGVIDYLVTAVNTALVPMATMAQPTSKHELKLYRCADPR